MDSSLGIERRYQWPLAGAIYFGLVFGAGFLLGLTRVLFVLPLLGERTAELIEMPVMLLVIVAAANWTVRTYRLAGPLGGRIAMGGVALALMLWFEFGLVLKLRHLTLTEYFQTRDVVAGTAYYLMLLVFAAMPVIVGRGATARRTRAAGDSEGGRSYGHNARQYISR